MLNPSGGLIYHGRAARYAKTLWAPFRTAVGSWLESWTPPEAKIMIIGASGGYMLPSPFLNRFRVILAVDPDPLARCIFQWRFRSLGKALQWESRDHFRFSEMSERPFRALLDANPDAAVLFSNLWGQVRFLVEDEDRTDDVLCFWQDRLPELLAGRSWASYHDRYSGTDPATSRTLLASDPKLTGTDLICRFYNRTPAGEWIDHLTSPFFPAAAHYDYFLWRFTPHSVHIVEGVYAVHDAS
jgi:hypothetical protein